jgi:hypothetical protein
MVGGSPQIQESSVKLARAAALRLFDSKRSAGLTGFVLK